MNKYEFHNKEKSIIRHNLVPEMLIRVIKLDRPNDYQSADLTFNDVFDEVFIRGWHHVFLLTESFDLDLDEVEDFSHIRSILKRAGKWYKSKVVIGEIALDKYVEKESPLEDDDFKLMKSDQPGWWLVAHKESGIIIEFQEGQFNNSQKISELTENQPSMMEAAFIMRSVGEWLVMNHSKLL